MTDQRNDLQVLTQEAQRFTAQMTARYGENLIRSSYGNEAEFQANIVMGLTRSGITGRELADVRAWLIEGLKPFFRFPPNIESLVHLALLLRAYPRTDYDQIMKNAWYKIDRSFGQRYSKSWRDEHPLDTLEKERVWLSAFADLEATEEELLKTLQKIDQSGYFRSFPPTLDQFSDAIIAVRKSVPMVEEAWPLALLEGNQDIPLIVRRAKGKIGGYNLMLSGRNRDVEQRFKVHYRSLLLDSDFNPQEQVFDTAPVSENEEKQPESIDKIKMLLG